MNTVNDRQFVYGLHKVLIQTFSNPIIIEELSGYLFDRLTKEYNISYFNFNDTEQCIIIKSNFNIPFIFENSIKTIFVDYVKTIMGGDSPTKQILLSNDVHGYIPQLIESGNFEKCTSYCVTTLNITPMNSEEIVIKVNLHN